jgi:glyoxylase-like metal-dependent hydrolase (beta-lactamase superfamily II)
MGAPNVFAVTAGVYCVMRRSYFTNSYLVDTGEGGLVAIDAGMKSNGSEMLSAIEQLGRKPTDVREILLTHWHNDHAAGASVLADHSGARVHYSAREADHLSRTVASTGLRGKLAAMVPENGPLVLLKGLLGNAPQQAVAATNYVRGGDAIGDFEILDTPGHTAGHVSYFFRPKGVLFAGDALAVIRHRLRFMARPTTEDVPTARASMLTSLELPIQFICPGHREPLTQNVEAECERMRGLLRSGVAWPLFG